MLVISDRKRALARDSRITVYRPGSSAFAPRPGNALFAADSVSALQQIMLKSFTPLIAANPEPLPSAMRQVSTKPRSAER